MTSTTITEPYIDLYLLPVPKANLGTYESHAMTFGTVTKELGALSYREFVADDPAENLSTEEGVVMTAAVVEFTSREHRDSVMAAVLDDPRVKELMGLESPADLSRMTYGGFEPLVTA